MTGHSYFGCHRLSRQRCWMRRPFRNSQTHRTDRRKDGRRLPARHKYSDYRPQIYTTENRATKTSMCCNNTDSLRSLDRFFAYQGGRKNRFLKKRLFNNTGADLVLIHTFAVVGGTTETEDQAKQKRSNKVPPRLYYIYSMRFYPTNRAISSNLMRV